jgi:hypothetical protein
MAVLKKKVIVEGAQAVLGEILALGYLAVGKTQGCF